MDEWLAIRAGFLTKEYGGDLEETRADLASQERKLRSFTDHDRVVLWFEHDLFCQSVLIYLLSWFSRQDLSGNTLRLICIDRFPGKPDFRGLGELNSVQLASLFDKQKEISGAELSLAAQAWEAYTSPTPVAISALLRKDTGALPFLAAGLRAHLALFPSVANGLGRVENKALALAASGAKTFYDLFNQFWAAEPVYGLGDLQFCSALRRLVTARHPLLTASPSGSDLSPEDLKRATFAITEAGKRTLDGEVDFIDSNGIDTWLGGVHLTSDSTIWRWDEERSEIVTG